MGNVTRSGIWTPDENDRLDPDVWSAEMAASIENGIGDRLERQELPVGLKASIAVESRVKFEEGIRAPFEILPNGTGCFTSNMEFDAGMATIPVAGMYFIGAASALAYWGAGPDSAPENENRSMALQIKRNGTDLTGCEVEASQRVWQTAQANTVVICVPGDIISVNWYSASPGGGNPDPTAGARIANNPALHSLSVVLITPTEG